MPGLYATGTADTRASDYIDAILALEQNAQQLDTYLLQEHFETGLAASTAFPQTLVTATQYGNAIPTLTGTAPTAKRVVSTLGHPGQWQLNTLTTASNKSMISLANSGAPEHQTGFFGKLAFRALVLTGATLPVGAVGATTYGEYRIGFTDTINSLAPVSGIEWVFDVAVDAHWSLILTAASTATKTPSTVTVLASTWYDLQLYVDASGVQARCAAFSATALPTLLANGPFTVNKPATTVSMLPHILIMNGTAGVTDLALTADLMEIAGQYVTPGVCSNYRGGMLTRSF